MHGAHVITEILFKLKKKTFDWVMSIYRSVRFYETQTVKSLLLLWKPRSWF